MGFRAYFFHQHGFVLGLNYVDQLKIVLNNIADTAEIYFLSFQKGEERGFAYYFHQYYRPLVFFAKKILRNETLAEDVVEGSFLKLWQKRAEIRGAGTIRSWLFTTVKYACYTELESYKVEQKNQKEIIYLAEISENQVSQELIKSATFSLLLESLEELPLASRKVFQMFYFEKKSYAQIAIELGLSEHTIRNQKARGMVLLRKRFLSVLPLFLLLC